MEARRHFAELKGRSLQSTSAVDLKELEEMYAHMAEERSLTKRNTELLRAVGEAKVEVFGEWVA